MNDYAIRTPALMDEQPILVYPHLAKIIGINEAIVVQQIYFWMNVNRSNRSERHYLDGHWWVYNSYAQWIEQHFPWLSVRGLQNIILQLENAGILLSRQGVENSHDRRKWYSVDLEKLHTIIQNGAMHRTKNVPSDSTKNVSSKTQKVCDVPYTEESTETTTEKSLSPALRAGEPALPIPDQNGLPNPRNPFGLQSKPLPTPTKPEQPPPPTPSPKPRSAKQLANDAANKAKADALGAALKIPPSAADEKSYVTVANHLLKGGIPQSEFVDYVKWVREQAEEGKWKVSLWSLKKDGRVSEYLASKQPPPTEQPVNTSGLTLEERTDSSFLTRKGRTP